MFLILRIPVHVLWLRVKVLCLVGTWRCLQISKYFPLYVVNSLQVSVANLNRALGLRTPLSPIFFFNFIHFSGTMAKTIGLHSRLRGWCREILDPPLNVVWTIWPTVWWILLYILSALDDDLFIPTGEVQKKIIPWRSMMPDQELYLEFQDDLQKKGSRSQPGGLILVTSLIDKPTNLGGEIKNKFP